MYNGIGLTTPRGSGTSGHVTKNMAHVRPEFFRSKVDANSGKARSHGDRFAPGAAAGGGANREILDHNRQRQIEGQLFELQEALIEQGKTDAEIESLMATKRRELSLSLGAAGSSSSSNSSSRGSSNGGGGSKVNDSHAAAMRKEEELSRARSAFRIKGDHRPGEGFDAEAQERNKMQAMEERQAREGRRDRSRSRDRG
jgi:serine/arginine repetitive matrix protein 2